MKKQFKLPSKFTKNNNKTSVPQSYTDNETVIFKGNHKGFDYSITKNDFARREITGTLKLIQNSAIVWEILQLHYGTKASAGIPTFAHEYMVQEVAAQ